MSTYKHTHNSLFGHISNQTGAMVGEFFIGRLRRHSLRVHSNKNVQTTSSVSAEIRPNVRLEAGFIR